MNPEPYDEVTIVLDWKTLHSIERVETLLRFGASLADFLIVPFASSWNVIHLVNYSPKKSSLNAPLSSRAWKIPKAAREALWFGYSIDVFPPLDSDRKVVSVPSLSIYFRHRSWPFNGATVVLRMVAGGDIVSAFERTVGLLGELRFGDDATVSCVLRCGTGDWMVAPDPIRSASGTISSSSSEITMELS